MSRLESKDIFIEEFSKLEDPRISRKKLYPIVEIIFLIVCASICGAESYRDYERFGKSRLSTLRLKLPFLNGIPSKSTIARVMRLISPDFLKSCFMGWMKSLYVCISEDVIPIDGKTLRGSHDCDDSAIHMVSAYSCQTHLVIGQQKVEDKSNEITAIPKLLDTIDISTSTVTIDAMGTQKSIAKKIIDKQGDYILALKGNHKNLSQDIQLYLDTEQAKPNNGVLLVSHDIDKGHGRIEQRTCYVTDQIDWLIDKDKWSGLKSIAMVESKRSIKNKTTTEKRYYITSKNPDPEYLNNAIRSHWSIENKLHWVLDVSMSEDSSRVRKDYAPENLAMFRHICLNMLQQAKKGMKDISIKGLRKLAGWCEATLIKIVSASF